MFWTSPLLILLGLIGLQLRQSERSGVWEKLGFFAAVVGLVLIIAGDIGLYWLGIDDDYIVTAPFTTPSGSGFSFWPWGPSSSPSQPPRRRFAHLGTAAFRPRVDVRPDLLFAGLGSFGAVLWALFGVGWRLGLSLAVEGFSSFLRKRRAARDGIAVKH